MTHITEAEARRMGLGVRPELIATTTSNPAPSVGYQFKPIKYRNNPCVLDGLRLDSDYRGDCRGGGKGAPVMTENAWLAQVRDLAALLGWMEYHTHNSMHSTKGFPDLVLVRERVIYAELKSDKGKTTPEQKVWLSLLRTIGQEVYVWRPSDFDRVTQILSKPKEG